MENVIALGTAACNFADSLYKQAPAIYKIFKIDNNIDGDNCFSLPEHSSWDEYDRSDIGKYQEFLRNIPSPKTLVASCGKTSGSVLRILEAAGKEDVTVVYLSPDVTSEIEMQRHKVVYGVLQEYARSGAIKELMCISNKLAENLCPNLTLANHWSGINSYISSIYHWHNVFQNTRPVLSGSDWPSVCKISTIGISEVNLEKEEILVQENLLSVQHGLGQKHYFFAIPEDIIKKEVGLHRKIKDYARSKQTEEIDTTFSVYSTTQDRPFCIIVQKTRDIQKSS